VNATMIISTKSGVAAFVTARRELGVNLKSMKVTRALTWYLMKDASMFLAPSTTFNNDSGVRLRLRPKARFVSPDGM
jgi:hypothetical protein